MEETKNIATCNRCQDKFNRKKLLNGPDSTLLCPNCLRDLYSSGDAKSKFKNSSSDLQEKLIPYPEIFSYHRKQENLWKFGNSSTTSLSKRPLQCPKADCNKFISLFTLESHFKYEHKEVPVVFAQLDARSALEFSPRDVRYNVTQCIVLLNVINHDFSNIFPRSSTQTVDSKPVMVLLATRIANCHLNQYSDESIYNKSNIDIQREDYDDDGDEDEVNSSHTYVENSSLLRPEDKIIIWLASNVYTNLSYTVAASTLSNKIRQKYFGPMSTLGGSPLELCKNGKCLILSHYHVNGMTENGRKPLALDVVVHSPD
ncbi:unnamed protein product [Phyllotreta striolata]|uniref:DUF4729 domain-containing protein n=1 Tax=Phyllotreta striolata TaxID=444603 RepID=A0A9N9TJM3_PHYSR|nr:unnamed protein product [Phyllotreta striolata]